MGKTFHSRFPLMRNRLHNIALGCLAALFVAGRVAAANLVPERVTFDSLASGSLPASRRPASP